MKCYWTVVIIFTLCACEPDGEGQTSGTQTSATQTSGTQTSGTQTSATQTSGTQTSGGGEDRCAELDPWECVGRDSEPHSATIECSSRSASECDGPVEEGEPDVCVWVETRRVEANARTCSEGVNSGACVAASYYGDGCPLTETCGASRDGETYYRVDDDCAIEVFTRVFCGYTVLDWQTCSWAVPAGNECALLPKDSPAACTCACA